MTVRAILCGLLLVISSVSTRASDMISMRATPEIAFAPATLMVRTAIEPDPDNRFLEIVIDSADFYRSSTIQLEGDKAPRTAMFEFRGIPSGNYEISARLRDQGGESRGQVRRIVDVIASGER
jgi:hypothetical protein